MSNGGVGGDEFTADGRIADNRAPGEGAAGDSKTSCLSDSIMVTRIIDGDTIVVAMFHGRETVRIVGIDTPELTPPAEPCAQAARDFVAVAIGSGSAARVDIQYDSSCNSDPLTQCRDIYGRLLGYIRLRNCTDLGAALIDAGLASVFRAFPFDRYASYDALEQQAQNAGVGIQAVPQCP